MPAAVATSEPATLNAGDTWAWEKTLPDYPATAWTLKYALQLPGAPLITLTATASGTTHVIGAAPTVTRNYPPGAWTWAAYVVAIVGGAQHTLERGALRILPSPLAPLAVSHAAEMLSLIQAALKNRIPAGLETTNIDGQELARIPIADLHTLRTKYRIEVAAENRAARSAAGIPQRGTIGIRFVKP